jgi:hypothetical protein
VTQKLGLWLTGGIGVLLAAIAILAFTAPTTIPPATSTATQIQLGKGHAQGERLKTHAWSADYDRITTSADQTVIELQGVHDGLIYKDGKPYLRVSAEHLTVNTLTKDFTANGRLHVERISGSRFRSFDTDAGSWNDAQKRIVFPDKTLITMRDGTRVNVGRAGLNLTTGHIHLEGVAGDS